MSRTIHVKLSDSGIAAALRELEEYKAWLQDKAEQLARKLTDIGAVNVSLGFARAIYTGDKDVSVAVEQLGTNQFAIVASGATVLILEFGAGVTYGYGHPNPSVDGVAMGPTTYPGQTHAADPKGWWIPGGEHTYGNPPSMTMYLTAKELRDRVEEAAREVFSS